MIGELTDIVDRLRSALPKRWFGDSSPNLDALLTSIATPWVWLYNVLVYTIRQTRITTASDEWLDLIAIDYFGPKFGRKVDETDSAYSARIRGALLRDATTRTAVITGLEKLTGTAPVVFEPANSMDTGGYGTLSNGPVLLVPGLAYGQAGGWGNLNLPYQFFIAASRPLVPGVATLAGYGTPSGGYGEGCFGYVSLSLLPGQVTDAEIQDTLLGLLPTTAVAWLRIN